MTWEDGYPLGKAKFLFSDRNTVQRLMELRQSHPIGESFQYMFQAIGKALEDEDSSPYALHDDPKFKEISEAASESSRLEQLIQDQVRAALLDGRLVGYGYAEPREPSSRPVHIPPDVWSGQIRWEKSEVSGNGLKFLLVRVLARENDEATQEAISDPDQSRPGRPSRRHQVERAFNALHKEGKIPAQPTALKALFIPILDKIDDLYPEQQGDRTGLGDKALYRIVRDILRENG